MDDFWSYIVNEVQNWEFRIEDILLHAMSGVIFGIILKIKIIFQSVKKLLFRKT